MIEKTTLTLFTRKGCHLCVKAKEVIEELQENLDFIYEEQDIEKKDEWTEKYGLMIPVVTVNGNEVQFGYIDKITLSKALAR
ncbi:glutaredoxin family protein [Niallia sp. XMNu-256]|uniref:glutaredoxin family protein n=1 Tax=Niallia sp. XMNu-256 TaxID=3082444 RepID=UPI0030CE3DCA